MPKRFSSVYSRRKLSVITFVYWFLLIYIIAALVWWFIALQKQNEQMYEYRIEQRMENKREISDERKRKISQYIGEGATFLVVILVGAVFVYRAVRKQFDLSHQQQNFMMAITHELKTPISVIFLSLETLQKRRLESEQQKKLIDQSLQEVTRLNTLTSNILVASQLESGNYIAIKETFDFSDVVKNEINHFKSRYPTREIKSNVEDNLTVKGESVLLRLLVSNLLDNAIKYSPNEKPVRVSVQKKDYKILIEVADEGVGIDDTEKKRVFEKFYRSGYESTRNSQGTGLGLYLCSRIAKDHNGKILIRNNKPAGSVFSVLLNSHS